MGYDDSLFLNKEAAAGFLCAVCLEISKDPVLLQPCEHVFCSLCAQSLSKCPSDQQRIQGRVAFHGQLNRLYCSLQMMCIHGSEGCTWSGTLGDIQSHLKAKCGYEETECPNTGCRERMTRIRFQLQHTLACPYRIEECEYCHAKFLKKDVNEHAQGCSRYPVCCPHKGCTHKAPRPELDEHLQKCFFGIIKCPFSQFGCPTVGPRVEIQEHISSANTNGEHLQLVIRFGTAAKQAADEMEERLRKMQVELRTDSPPSSQLPLGANTEVCTTSQERDWSEYVARLKDAVHKKDSQLLKAIEELDERERVHTAEVKELTEKIALLQANLQRSNAGILPQAPLPFTLFSDPDDRPVASLPPLESPRLDRPPLPPIPRPRSAMSSSQQAPDPGSSAEIQRWRNAAEIHARQAEETRARCVRLEQQSSEYSMWVEANLRQKDADLSRLRRDMAAATSTLKSQLRLWRVVRQAVTGSLITQHKVLRGKLTSKPRWMTLSLDGQVLSWADSASRRTKPSRTALASQILSVRFGCFPRTASFASLNIPPWNCWSVTLPDRLLYFSSSSDAAIDWVTVIDWAKELSQSQQLLLRGPSQPIGSSTSPIANSLESRPSPSLSSNSNSNLNSSRWRSSFSLWRRPSVDRVRTTSLAPLHRPGALDDGSGQPSVVLEGPGDGADEVNLDQSVSRGKLLWMRARMKAEFSARQRGLRVSTVIAGALDNVGVPSTQ